MLEARVRIPARNGRRLAVRIGINSGPLVGGVIVTNKFHYDVRGDTVNSCRPDGVTASQTGSASSLTSSASPGVGPASKARGRWIPGS